MIESLTARKNEVLVGLKQQSGSDLGHLLKQSYTRACSPGQWNVNDYAGFRPDGHASVSAGGRIDFMKSSDVLLSGLNRPVGRIHELSTCLPSHVLSPKALATGVRNFRDPSQAHFASFPETDSGM